MFLRLLKDNRLITKELFQKLENNADDDSLYHMLECIETAGKKEVRNFWQCVIQDHILQRYPQISEITKTLKNVLPKPEKSHKIRESSEDCSTEVKKEVKRMKTESSCLDNQAGPSSQSTKCQMKTSEHVVRDSPAPQNHYVRKNNETKVKSNEQDVGNKQEVKKIRTESSSVNNLADPSSQSTNCQMKTFEQVERASPAPQTNSLGNNKKTKVKSTKQDVRKERESISLNNHSGLSSQITNSQKKTCKDVEKDSPAPQNHSVKKNNETEVKSNEQDVGKELQVKKMRTESSSVNKQAGPSSQSTNCQMKTSENLEIVSPASQSNSLGKNDKTKMKSTEQDVGKEVKKTESNSVNNQAGPSSQIASNQKTSEDVEKDKQEIWMWPIYKTLLPVTCGNKEGTLFRDKLAKGEECILFHESWYTPTNFEKFAGKEKVKNWKFSIRCGNTPLKKLIMNTNEQFPVSSKKRSSKDSKISFGLVEENDPEHFQEQGGKEGGTEFRGRVEEEEDMTDLSVFQAPSLPVTCVSLTGTLFKYRFASGSRGKCIRTEERWFTPEEFVKQELTLTDGHWRKDILCCGKPLNFLLQMAQNNDDECYVCRSEKQLRVCCDECPRVFHSHCHLPTADGDSPGEWICTFCVLRNSQQWRDSSNMSEQEAFNAPVSQYILYCHYLLLRVYREDIKKVYVKDPCKTVPRYSEFITQLMWLDRIKQKLESGAYQTVGAFVSDFQLIFSNSRTFNRDNEFGRMGARLKKMFEEEFQKIFSIQQQVVNTAKEPQDMEESDTDTTSDSETESEWDSESSTGSDSLSENDSSKNVKRGKKRKMKKRNCKQTGPSSLCTPKKRQVEDSSLYLTQKFGNKSELPVTCGDKDGILHVEKFNNMEKCIFSEDQWFTPNEFEKFGGKERSKKWKNSIFCDNIPLQKFIEAELLTSYKKSWVKNKQNGSPESSPVADRLIKRKCQRQLFPSCSESNGRNNNDNGGTVNETDEDIIDMTIFEGPTLPVTCDSGSGILHKYRFATGRCGRCIRTKDFWLTPEEFIQVSKPDGTWRKDILSNGVPLGKLIMKRVLELHMINCDCEICEELDQYLNDDVCFICDSGGDLVCCDECPRAFHPHCHLPAADGELSGSKWSCTFCLMKNMESSSQKTQQDVLSSPVSQYTLHCQYLLLQLLHESMTEPCANVSGYSENICGPMMLGRVKMNLENNDYKTVEEFVSDIELIFNNFCTSSRDNDSSRMTYRLKEVFNREFESIFMLQ
ncbi:hypothetical protein QQF64_024441 [Cirrhinus molitorella]|uniref:Nuclear body protein SP140-like protein n=1 Tax=Cirrhinus molitorella TaxID=172907 RepID=A0ABR3NL91_9TELE